MAARKKKHTTSLGTKKTVGGNQHAKVAPGATPKPKARTKATARTSSAQTKAAKATARKNGAQTAEQKLFKDYFDRATAKSLGSLLAAAYPSFKIAPFVRDATTGLEQLEMIGRVKCFSDAMRRHLPDNIPQALQILTKSLPPPLTDTAAISNGFMLWPFGQFILDHSVEYPTQALPAMYELTQRFSSEYAVRPFIERYPKQTLEQLLAWTQDENLHVRRWCSEGSRTRLPWGKRLDALVTNPKPLLPILEALKDDPELYVRKSVANSLNDISKDHPDVALRVCTSWKRGASKERLWLINHALRTLLKAGDPAALKLVGFGPPPKLASSLRLSHKKLAIGETLSLDLTLKNSSKSAHPLLVDFRVHYAGPSDKARKPKVFKWTQCELGPQEVVHLSKNLKLQHATIRTLHPGRHLVDVQVNGAIVADAAFELT